MAEAAVNGSHLCGAFRLVVVMTSHNRLPMTERILRQLFAHNDPRIDLSVVLVDDGSSDGTHEMVREHFPEVHLIRGTGDLYWARGMALAERYAWDQFGDFDYLLWLNDDCALDSNALSRLLDVSLVRTDKIVVGPMRDSNSGRTSYGGLVRSRWHPLRTALLPSADKIQLAHTFNGNCVLVPAFVASRVGRIDDFYQHQYADIDYGLRATKYGIEVCVVPGTVGTCDWGDRPRLTGSPFQRWSLLNGPKGILPWRDQLHFLRIHAGWLWLPLFVWSFGSRLFTPRGKSAG